MVFQWRDRKGNMHYPKDMSTKHVFYAWLMIWNHAAPEHMRIWNNHKYRFPAHYSREYVLESFRELYYELKQRSDLGIKSKKVVNIIEGYYRRQYGRIIDEDMRGMRRSIPDY
jgi:hypothetical protein